MPEQLSKQDKQVVKDEATAEKVFQAGKAEEKGIVHVPPKVLGKILDEVKARPPMVPPSGSAIPPDGVQILRTVSTGTGFTGYYCQGIGPPYVGQARWVQADDSLSKEEQTEIIRKGMLHA